MSIIDTIEKRFLFRFTRFLALLFILIAFLISVGVSIYAGSLINGPSIKVSESEINLITERKKIEETQNKHEKEIGEIKKITPIDELASIKLPFIVQKYFSDPENMKLLKDWLKPLSPFERDVFIEELSRVIKKSEESDIDVISSINAYYQIKESKIQNRNLENNNLFGVTALVVVGICIIIIALFSLVLVMLAIERNTRNKINV